MAVVQGSESRHEADCVTVQQELTPVFPQGSYLSEDVDRPCVDGCISRYEGSCSCSTALSKHYSSSISSEREGHIKLG